MLRFCLCEDLFQKIISDWAEHVTRAQTMSNEAIVDEEPSNAAINPAGSSGDMGGMAANDDGFTLYELQTMQDSLNYALSGNHPLCAKLERHIKGMGGMVGSDMGGMAGSIGDITEFIREEIDEVCNAAAKLIQAWWCVKRSYQA